MDNITVEVCCADMPSVLAAREGGAHRIELCSALSCGGVTPSFASAVFADEIFDNHVVVLIRCREGDYVYSQSEKELMLRDIRVLRDVVSGFRVGALNPDGTLDMDFLAKAVSAAGDKPVSLHRCFDVCANRLESIPGLAETGIKTILTSGGAPSAPEGTESLRLINEEARRHGITILAGAGINARNAATVAAQTGVTEIHGSFRNGGRCTEAAEVRAAIKNISEL